MTSWPACRSPALALCLAMLPLTGCRGGPWRPAQPPVPVSPPSSGQSAVAEGRALFYRAVGGEAQLVRACQEHWTRLRDADPANPLAAAYLGATITFSASLERWPPRKGELAKRGLLLLEDAVAGAPDDVEVRFLRGMASRNVPAFFGRRAVAREDLTYAARAAPAAVAAGRLDRSVAAASLYHYGLLREADRDASAARDAWRAAVDLGPDTPPGRKAREKLNDVR